MKVLCIDGVNKGTIGILNGREAFKAEEIYEGEVYTVCGEETIKGETAYSLSEKPSNALYRAKRFVPLSEKEDTQSYSVQESDTTMNHNEQMLVTK